MVWLQCMVITTNLFVMMCTVLQLWVPQKMDIPQASWNVQIGPSTVGAPGTACHRADFTCSWSLNVVVQNRFLVWCLFRLGGWRAPDPELYVDGHEEYLADAQACPATYLAESTDARSHDR